MAAIDLGTLEPARTALMLCDLQNDFLHPDGAYGRAKVGAAEIAALPNRVANVADAVRKWGGWIVSTHFTLVPGPDGEPYISDHLRELRPFLGRGDFYPGDWGHDVIDALQPVDFKIEKVAFSAFYQSRLEFVLRKAGADTLIFTGIVTNGGVASTLRGAHVRDFRSILLSDGCAAFDPSVHEATVKSLGTLGPVMTCAELISALSAA